MDKIPLVYIGGCGHSGSTLLDLILGSHPALISLGEIVHYDPVEWGGKTCTCGKRFRHCPFWKDVNRRFSKFLAQNGRNLRENSLASPSYLHLKDIHHLFDLYSPSPSSPRDFAKDSALLFRSVLDTSGKEIVVDSSKPPSRALYLHQSGYFDMKVVYLVRNGKAFIWSWRKRNMPSYKAVAYWTIRNLRMRKLIRRHLDSSSVIQVKYEDFAREPGAELDRLCEFLGVPYVENC